MLSDPRLIIEKLQEVHNFFLAKKEKAISDNIRNLDLYLYLCNVADEGMQRVIAITLDWPSMYYDIDLENDSLVKDIFYQYERTHIKNEHCISLAKCLVDIRLCGIFNSKITKFKQDAMFNNATHSCCDSTGMFYDYDYEAY